MSRENPLITGGTGPYPAFSPPIAFATPEGQCHGLETYFTYRILLQWQNAHYLLPIHSKKLS